MNVDYTTLPELVNISAEQLVMIEDASKGLSQEECLALCNIDMPNLSIVERVYVEQAIKRGRLKGKKEAVDELFKQMKRKGGTTAALSYLVKTADEFKSKEGENVGGFTLKIVPNE